MVYKCVAQTFVCLLTNFITALMDQGSYLRELGISKIRFEAC